MITKNTPSIDSNELILKTMKRSSVLLLIAFCINAAINAQTSLPAFFSDNMVLQQDEEVAIWGFDKPGTTITIESTWGTKTEGEANGTGKWKLAIKTPAADGKSHKLTISGSETIEINNLLLGEVWFCSGQSNMVMPVRGNYSQPIIGSNEAILNSANNNIRLFKASQSFSETPMEDVEGSWKVAGPPSVAEFSATAYFFAIKLESVLQVPVGMIVSAWGGTAVESWMDEESLSQFDDFSFHQLPETTLDHKWPSRLYNAMINPYVGLSIKGALWYQGEANRRNAEEYNELFPAMISSWRKNWGIGDFPFYYVQIAPKSFNPVNPAFLREAQLRTMEKLDHVGMVSTLDIGECDQIHPAEKQKVGERLAYWAFARNYGYPEVACSGPVFKGMEILEGGEVNLFFDHCPNGITSFGRELSGFTIAGKDRVFHPADAKIIPKTATVTVWCKDIDDPVAVRYAFTDCPTASLFGVGGLPASSFRTDDWDE